MQRPADNLVTWSDALSLSLPEVDHQHQVLINIINQIWHKLVRPANGEPPLEQLLGDLQDYSETHFAAEEEMMRSFEYPHLERHRMSHREFVGYIAQAREELDAGKPIALELLRFLNDWLIHHIKVVDRDYATHITGRQSHGILKRFTSVFHTVGSMMKGGEGDAGASALFEGLDMQQAIRFHNDWRTRLADHIEGRTGTEPDINRVVRDDLCVLGNWLKLRADEGWLRKPEFATLLKDHREFHFCAGQVLAEYDAGNIDKARGLLRTDFRRISDRVRFDIFQLYGSTAAPEGD